MKAIISTNKLNYIGKDGKLMWHNAEDLKHFKSLTEGGKLLVGYNTFQNLPPLKNREVIVDKRGDELVDVSDIDWCIGGKKTYEKYAHLIDEFHISFINNDKVGDTSFPNVKSINDNCKFFYYFFGF